MTIQRATVVSTASKLDALFPFVRELSPAGRELLDRHAIPRTLPPGTMVLSEGQVCVDLLLVTLGHLRVFKTSPGGREITIYRVYPGDGCVISVSSVLSGAPYPANVVTPVATQVMALPAAQMRALYEREPAVQTMVARDMAGVLAEMMTLVAEVAFRRMDARLAALLVRESASTPAGVITLSHEEMALHLGTAREVVSRLLENLRADGLIHGERRAVTVLDPSALQALAASG